jgi:hypothetical protein
MEFVVDATPDQCIQALWEYFRQEWPFRGTVYKTETGILFYEPNPGMLTVLFKDSKSVNVSVEEESLGHTRLYVLAERRNHASTLEKWIREELPQRAAAVEPKASSETAPASPDIPEQIKKLAELRDAGAITEEEFERKKAELLDRM